MNAQDFIAEKAKTNHLLKGMGTNIALFELLDEYSRLKMAEKIQELCDEIHEVLKWDDEYSYWRETKVILEKHGYKQQPKG